MNDLMTQTSSTAVANAPATNFFEQYAEATNRNAIVGDLLKFSKGHYTSGQDDKPVKEGTQLVANMDELMVGWVKWEGGKPADQIMGKVVEGYVPPKRNTLGDTDESQWEIDEQSRQPRDPWQLTNYLIFKEPAGDQLYTYATSSKGGINAIGKLCGTFGKHMRAKPDEFPIVSLGVDSYRHPNKAYGLIFTPKFDVTGWTSKAAFAEALATEAAEQAAKAADKASDSQTRF
jgi:hypothetical protein